MRCTVCRLAHDDQTARETSTASLPRPRHGSASSRPATRSGSSMSLMHARRSGNRLVSDAVSHCAPCVDDARPVQIGTGRGCRPRSSCSSSARRIASRSSGCPIPVRVDLRRPPRHRQRPHAARPDAHHGEERMPAVELTPIVLRRTDAAPCRPLPRAARKFAASRSRGSASAAADRHAPRDESLDGLTLARRARRSLQRRVAEVASRATRRTTGMTTRRRGAADDPRPANSRTIAVRPSRDGLRHERALVSALSPTASARVVEEQIHPWLRRPAEQLRPAPLHRMGGGHHPRPGTRRASRCRGRAGPQAQQEQPPDAGARKTRGASGSAGRRCIGRGAAIGPLLVGPAVQPREALRAHLLDGGDAAAARGCVRGLADATRRCAPRAMTRARTGLGPADHEDSRGESRSCGGGSASTDAKRPAWYRSGGRVGDAAPRRVGPQRLDWSWRGSPARCEPREYRMRVVDARIPHSARSRTKSADRLRDPARWTMARIRPSTADEPDTRRRDGCAVNRSRNRCYQTRCDSRRRRSVGPTLRRRELEDSSGFESRS